MRARKKRREKKRTLLTVNIGPQQQQQSGHIYVKVKCEKRLPWYTDCNSTTPRASMRTDGKRRKGGVPHEIIQYRRDQAKKIFSGRKNGRRASRAVLRARYFGQYGGARRGLTANLKKKNDHKMHGAARFRKSAAAFKILGHLRARKLTVYTNFPSWSGLGSGLLQ